MKKIIITLAFLVGSFICIFANQVKITTSCGKTVYIESSDYKNEAEIKEHVKRVNKAFCPGDIIEQITFIYTDGSTEDIY